MHITSSLYSIQLFGPGYDLFKTTKRSRIEELCDRLFLVLFLLLHFSCAQRIQLTILTIRPMHSSLVGVASSHLQTFIHGSFFTSWSLCSAVRGLLVVPRMHRATAIFWSFSYVGPSRYNHLPQELWLLSQKSSAFLFLLLQCVLEMPGVYLIC